jgi:hypothetical protein
MRRQPRVPNTITDRQIRDLQSRAIRTVLMAALLARYIDGLMRQSGVPGWS